MNISDFIVTMSQNSELNTTSLFPFPFKVHLIFSLLALVFFIIMFSREKKPHQLIMGIAIQVSLAIWLSDGKTLFYVIGIAEVVFILAALISSIIYNRKKGKTLAAENECKSDEISDENSTGDDTK